MNKIVDRFYEIFYDVFGLAASNLPVHLLGAFIIDVFVRFLFPWPQSPQDSRLISPTWYLSQGLHFLILVIIKFQLQLLFVCSFYFFDLMNMINMIVYEFLILAMFRDSLSVCIGIIWTLTWIFGCLVFAELFEEELLAFYQLGSDGELVLYSLDKK